MGIKDKAKVTKLNKRQVSEIRADLMRSARQICNRLAETVLGKKHTELCDCGSEYEVFQGTGLELTAPQVAASKTLLQKVFPDISPEDFDSATTEYSPKDAIDEISKYLKQAEKETLDQFKAKGIYITIDKPVLKAV